MEEELAELRNYRRTTSNGSVGGTRRLMRGTVRALERCDVAHVARLHENVSTKTTVTGTESLEERLQTILLDHPWYDDTIPSLVFEGEDGRILGCLGVMPRPMSFNGRNITAAVSHSFIVEPGSRSTLAALELAKRFLSGPQDISMAEGSSTSRRIWESNGGSTSLLYSLCWTRPLRPSRYVLLFLSRRGLPAVFEWILKPFCRLIDGVTPLIPQKPFRVLEPTVSGEELDGETLCRTLPECTRNRSLRPRYDKYSSSWLLEFLARKSDRGTFQRVLVRSGDETVGWYIYYEKSDGVGEVVQIAARRNCIEEVLDHLFHSARKRGLVAVSGQMDPALFPALASKHCLFHHDGGSWMLIHSRDPELLHAIHGGDAFLTRLDGEWWISSILG